MRTLLSMIVLSSGVLGCSSSTLDDDAGHVRTWINTGSAVAVWSRVNEVVAFADGHSGLGDGACPARTDDGTTLTITGDCTEAEGQRWVGSATVTRAADGARRITYVDFARVNDFGNTLSGTFEVRPLGEDLHAFSADLVDAGVMTTSIEYQGTVSGDYAMRTLWNGTGQFDRDGFGEPDGLVTITTVDEVFDDALCMGQAASGQVTIEGDDHVAVVTYDGATDCDEDKAAEWTYDGEARGRVTGLTCAVVAPGAAPPSSPVLAAALAFGAVFAIRLARRRRR